MSNAYQIIKGVIKERKGMSLYRWVFDSVEEFMPGIIRKMEQKTKKAQNEEGGPRVVNPEPLLNIVQRAGVDRLEQYVSEYQVMFGREYQDQDTLVSQAAKAITMCEGMARWEYSKGVYHIHPLFFEELIKTQIEDRTVTVDEFLTLPELGVLVEFPRPLPLPVAKGVTPGTVNGGLFWLGKGHGGVTHLEAIFPKDNGMLSFISLDLSSDMKLIDILSDQIDKEKAKLFVPILNIILYISEVAGWKGDRDIIPPKVSGATWRKKGKKMILEVPREPAVWRVGEYIGNKLERWVEEEKKRTIGGVPSPRGPVRPHYRRAHWRRVRCGKGRTSWKLIWVHQCYVNCDVEEGINLPVCHREVKSY